VIGSVVHGDSGYRTVRRAGQPRIGLTWADGASISRLSMTQASPDASEIRQRRLLFRATHRGTQENDLIIGGFVARRIHTLTTADLDALEEILELPDPALADWLTGRAPIPPENDSPMLRRIRDAAADSAGTAP
jgi:antitoxin CptB